MRHCFRITTMFQNSDISTFPNNRASNQIHKFSDFKFVFAGTELVEVGSGQGFFPLIRDTDFSSKCRWNDHKLLCHLLAGYFTVFVLEIVKSKIRQQAGQWLDFFQMFFPFRVPPDLSLSDSNRRLEKFFVILLFFLESMVGKSPRLSCSIHSFWLGKIVSHQS